MTIQNPKDAPSKKLTARLLDGCVFAAAYAIAVSALELVQQIVAKMLHMPDFVRNGMF